MSYTLNYGQKKQWYICPTNRTKKIVHKLYRQEVWVHWNCFSDVDPFHLGQNGGSSAKVFVTSKLDPCQPSFIGGELTKCSELRTGQLRTQDPLKKVRSPFLYSPRGKLVPGC